MGHRQRGRGWRLGGEKESEESVSCVVSAWLDEDGIQESYGPREPSCRHSARPQTAAGFRHCRKRKNSPESDDRTCMACGVDDEKLTREVRLEFCEADVRKPLASAVRVAKAGNGIWLEAHGCYIENLATKERMEVREENGVYVMDVQFDDETVDVITGFGS